MATQYIEVTRKWNDIPSNKPTSLRLTETYYHQEWPFNSYIDEKKEAQQAVLVQLAPPASMVQDVMNEKYEQAVISTGLFPILTADPVTAAVAKTFYNVGKLLGWWGKKKDDDSTKWNARRPAGCASIAFLQMLCYYKDITAIGGKFPELKKLYKEYKYDSGKFTKTNSHNSSGTKLTDTDVNVVKSVMEKICKAIPASVYTESGTAVIPIFIKKAAENMHLKQFHEPLVKPNKEDAAKYMYQALCNDIIPIMYIGDINREGTEIDFSGEKWKCFHYFLVDGFEFDKMVFARTGKYLDACKFRHNDGWGYGSEKAQSFDDMILAVAGFQASIFRVFFFAPEKKREVYRGSNPGNPQPHNLQEALR